MKRFVTGQARGQAALFPEWLEDFVGEDNPVRVIDAFVEELDLRELGFKRVDPRTTGRPAYHPAVLLKLYIDGYLNRVQSSPRLERECQRNLELMWPTHLLAAVKNRRKMTENTHAADMAISWLRFSAWRYGPQGASLASSGLLLDNP